MTTEEKAKAYDEAIKQAEKEILACGSLNCDAARQIFRLFPQLRESNDEKIYRELTEYLNKYVSDSDTRKKPWLLYLDEKQKQDKIQRCGISGYTDIITAIRTVYNEESAYELIEYFTNLVNQNEQKPELVLQPPITYTYNSNASKDERLKAALLALLNSDLVKVKEGGYFTKKDLIKWVQRIPTDKPTWSEEDEKMLWSAINGLNQDIYEKERNWLANRFKSIRSSWKPSESQIYALKVALETFRVRNSDNISAGNDKVFTQIESLYEQLKKL